MSRFFARVSLFGMALGLLVAFAPTVGAQGTTPSGSFTVTYYNYIAAEGGAVCPSSGGIPGGIEGALNTFHYWPEGTSPYPGVNVDHYTVCWDGFLNFPTTGTWNVQTVNDDGMDIWVDGQITMRAWYDQGPSLHNGSIYIGSSIAHHVVIKYYNDTLGGTACVGWDLAGNAIGYWNCPNPLGPAYVPQPAPVVAGPSYIPPYAYTYPPPYIPPYAYTYPPPYVAAVPQLVTVLLYPQPCPWCYVRRYRPAFHCAYVVQTGDILSEIAARYGMNYWDLAEANGLYNPNFIYAGMRLFIPNCR